MSKAIYGGVNYIARKAKSFYGGVNNVARKITKAYIGDENGIARQFWPSGFTWKKYNVAYSYSRISTYNSVFDSGGAGWSRVYLSDTIDIRNGKFYGSSYTTSPFSTKNGQYINLRYKYVMIADYSDERSSDYKTVDLYSSNSAYATYAFYVSGTSKSSTGYGRWSGTLYQVGSPYAGSFISTVESENESDYPVNGIHTDGYWYVKQ